MNYFKRMKGILAASTVTAVSLCVLAFLLYRFQLSLKTVELGIVVIYVFSNFIGGFVAGKTEKKNKFLWGMISGAGYLAIILVMTLLAHRGISGKEFWLAFVLCCGGGMLGGMIS